MREMIDLRGYMSVARLIFATRLQAALSQGELPKYRKLQLNEYYVRAGDDFGESGFLIGALNLEMRFNLLPVQYYNFTWVPIMGKYLENLPFSVEGFFFNDIGQTFNRNIETDNISRLTLTAFGAGMQFRLPFVETVHILAGWQHGQPIDDPNIKLQLSVTF